MTTTPRRAATSPVSVKLDAEQLTREELRQDFADEAEKALADYKRTGLHVTLDEVDAWVKSLGTRKPKRFPKCHK